MTQEFTAANYSFRTPQYIETPYLKARQEWDERIGSTVVQTKNWRLGFFVISVIALGLVGVNVYQLTLAKVVPMVITVSQDTGETKVLGKIADLQYQPKELEIKYFLTQFVLNVRTVSTDPVVIKKNWLGAYKFLKPQAANLLNDLTNTDEDSALKKIGQETVVVKPISVVAVENSKSYQVRWKETRYMKTGAPLGEKIMAGVFTIEVETPRDEDSLSVNPLGIYISHFQWNKEL